MASILRDMLLVDDCTTAAVGALCGVAFHTTVAASTFEFELIMFHFGAIYALTFTSYTAALVRLGNYTALAAFGKASLAATSFNIAILTSISIYRLFFHRCRHFPGPTPAALTRLHAAYLSSKDLNYSGELKNMHDKYGDFVRVGPREISVMRKEAVDLVFGPRSQCQKSSWYGQTGNDARKVSLNTMRDRRLYKLRRRVWDRALSTKSVAMYQPRVKAKADTLAQKIREADGKPMDMTEWSMFYAFDIMGSVGFSTEFNNMSTATEHPAIQPLHMHMKELAILSQVPWLENIVASIPGAGMAFVEFFRLCDRQIRETAKIYNSEKQPEDIVSWLLKAVREKDPGASPTHEALIDDTRVVVIAGSDTTAIAETCVLYYLAKNQRVQTKLREKLDKAMPGGPSTWKYETVKAVTYIDNVINETLRLMPPFMSIPTRETPKKGLQIGDTWIPGNVHVRVPVYQIQRDPRYWPHAEQFVPERWGERREEMGTDGAPFFPFNIGTHSCPGLSLAMLNLRTAVSTILQNFVIEVPEGTIENIDAEIRDTLMMKLPPIPLRFVPRS